ncbi:MAG: ribonuclease HI [Verrucomicrobia bacterium]|nr:ribonuclease HI [Verrucomicrobiota bacterium]
MICGQMHEVTLYTDGACRGNPGKGGCGVVLISGSHRKELSAGYVLTTNNRMELMAAILGLSALKSPCHVQLFSDSKYLVDSMNLGWVQKWKATQWRKKENVDLWIQILDLCDIHQVRFHWVKGHADNAENKRCDELAVLASQSSHLITDAGYENEIQRRQAQSDLFD